MNTFSDYTHTSWSLIGKRLTPRIANVSGWLLALVMKSLSWCIVVFSWQRKNSKGQGSLPSYILVTTDISSPCEKSGALCRTSTLWVECNLGQPIRVRCLRLHSPLFFCGQYTAISECLNSASTKIPQTLNGKLASFWSKMHISVRNVVKESCKCKKK